MIAAATAAASIVSSPSDNVGAITGTLRSGSVSSGETKIVEPDTCMVYCEAPITVARMRASGRASCGPVREPRAHLGGELRAEIAVRFRLAAIDVFGDAAGKAHVGQLAAEVQRSRAATAGAAGARRAARHRFEQAVGHARGERVRRVFGEHRARLELQAELGAEAAAGFLEPHDAARVVEHDEPRADVERGDVDHPAVGADRDLRGAAADVDIHHRRAVADRARRGARAVGRHHRFQAVAGADRDHLARLAGEQFADAPRIAPPHRDAGQDERAGIDLVRVDSWRPYIGAR